MDRSFTAEQIAKIAPGYKGKPEKFDLSKVKSKKGRKLIEQSGSMSPKPKTETTSKQGKPVSSNVPKPASSKRMPKPRLRRMIPSSQKLSLVQTLP